MISATLITLKEIKYSRWNPDRHTCLWKKEFGAIWILIKYRFTD